MNSELEVGARPVDGQRATESPPSSEGPIPQPTVASAPAPQQKETDDKSSGRSEPDDSVAKPFYQGFKAGDTDPLVDVVIKEILVKTDAYIVYIDRDLVLHWHWNETVDSNRAAPILNRASELQAKSEFLRQTLRNRDLISARRLIGEGLVVMFSTQDQTYANAALDTAEKFITQIGTETSRGWYFVPFFIFFAVSAVIGLILYRHGQMRITTLPLVCSLAGGMGAFISTAIGNERIPCAPSAGRFLHLLEALLRYTIGFAAGLFVWLAVSGNIAVGFLNLANSSNNQATNPWSHNSLPASIYALIAVTILAGASERLFPSFIAKFDDSTKPADTPQTAKSEAPEPNPTGATK